MNETKIIIHKSAESVMERDENIDDLMIQSEDLSTQSKLFYRMGPCIPLFEDIKIRISNLWLISYRASEKGKLMLCFNVRGDFVCVFGLYGQPGCN